jgi:hypothetical protein
MVNQAIFQESDRAFKYSKLRQTLENWGENLKFY